MPIKVLKEKCQSCSNLINCPAAAHCVPGALNFDQEKRAVYLKNDRCWNCRRCLAYCNEGGLIYEE